jgi:hypothetical protein
MHAAMQVLSQSILPSWHGDVACSASARGDISSGIMSVPDIVMIEPVAANARGYSGETISPTIKSIRKMMHVFLTFDF